IQNLTGDPSLVGGYAFPPDYPVLTSLELENPSVTYETTDGTELTVNLVDPIFPGVFSYEEFYFDPSVEFASISFSAAIYPGTFLAGSQWYQAADPTASALLENGDGSPLAPFVATADIDVQADPTGAIPEPGSALLLGSALLAGFAAWRRKRS